MSKRRANRLHRLRREKRGVVLLVVVSLLTLFLMIGVTYVLIAGNYQNASAQNQRAHRYGDEPEREMEEVLGQILYGNNQFSTRSVLGPHSLLEDLYGRGDMAIGTVANVPTTQNGGQTVYFSVTFNIPNPVYPIPNYYAGRVITFTNGPAAGLSTRVMAYFPAGFGGTGVPELMVEALESDLPIPVLPAQNNRFVINGAPFNGTGEGYSAGSFNLDDSITMNSGTAYPIALLPNYPFSTAPGGRDEPWDVPDYQNPFLALVPPQKLAQFDGFPLLPSYHRPDLVKYWINYLSGTSLLSGSMNPRGAFLNPYGDPSLSQAQIQEIIAIKRMLLFRPLIEDHPNFTGGNQNFVADSLNGPYDVDNDGDGISDSIWVDAGLPVVTAPNGRRYKRLVAILIKDLDGRVNPSVHGNLNLANIPTSRTQFQVTDMFAGMDPNSPYPINLPRGFGYGPAEVDFRHIFNNVTPYSTASDNAGMYFQILTQRYAPFPNPTGQAQYPGLSDGVAANVNNDDLLSRLKTIGMPYDHTSALSAYSTPPDVWGRAALAVDYTGQPIWGFAGSAERIDDPYEMQWNQLRASADAPYTVSELEALLRYHDLGASVPGSQLINLSGGIGGYLASEPRGTPGASQIRRAAFGMGSYIPAPKMIVPRELRAAYGTTGNSTILDLYYASIISGRSWNQTVGSNPADPDYNNLNTQIQTIVPFEILKGQMFNLNRELGNGIDDNGNGVIDEPGEPNEQIPTTAGQMNFDYFNDSNSATTYDNRQMMARHLYCMMMLLRNRTQNYDLDFDGNRTQAETAKMFAQWAINVVDFRDADSIMTRFEYDQDPFDGNGWAVDGDPTTTNDTQMYGGVVWGLERPELLLTENIGGHDRRTLDTDKDPTMKKTTDMVMKDNDFDQELMPQGWAFIELYNPWFDKSNNSYDHKPSELYTNGGVDLARVNGAGSPVWRMIFMHGNQGTRHFTADPDSPQPEALTMGVNGALPAAYPAPSVDRSIYFADLNGGGVNLPGGNLGEVYFPSSSVFPAAGAGGTRIPPVMPGRYAVVGSSGNPDTGAANYGNHTYTTYLGRRTDAGTSFDPGTLNLPMTRRIVLDTANQRVQVLDNRNNAADDVTNPTDLQPVVTIPIDYVLRNSVAVAQSFTVTEPINGYLANPPPATSMWQPPGPNDEGHFSPPADEPLDAPRGGEFAFLLNDTTNQNFRTVHLQRLANPLIAWNAVSNPYMTVDTSSMDVMAYNGVTADMDPNNMPLNRNFQSFQRGGPYYPTDPEAVGGYMPPTTGYFRRLWQQESLSVLNGDSPTEGGTGPHIQPRPLYNSLGYLNKRYQPYFTAMAASADVRYKGAPYFQDANGAIASPFPYFAFNNRPFNNPAELMNVPCWHSSKVLEHFIFEDHTATNWTNMYLRQFPAVPNAPYGHLLNFFWTASGANANDAAELSRIFDFVETRSPFVDTEKYYNPYQFFSGNPAPAGFRPPFNYLSRFREPGRININTIFDDNVWNAAVRGSPAMCTFPQNTGEGDGGQFLLRLAMNRQGWGSNPTDLLTTSNYDVTQPSYFSNPFRTADSADMMPNNPATLRQTAANGGLLRRDPAKGTVGFASPPPPPLPTSPTLDGNQPLFSSESVTPYQDAARNPYFRFQPLQKVDNIFSTNSNCYAVWMTIGYFEVESNGTPPVIDQVHPDGLRLAQEVGVDEGNVKRHRSFYIIDRSIPVAFEPGHRHNTDKAVLLKRFIE
jgi:hypothetical protein